MTELSIDTKNKRVCVRLELLGEKEPIEVEILRYSLKEKGETTYITIEEATSSREWLTVALREFVVGDSVARVRELENIRQFLTSSALTLVIDLFFTFVFLAVMFYYSPTLTWIVAGS